MAFFHEQLEIATRHGLNYRECLEFIIRKSMEGQTRVSSIEPVATGPERRYAAYMPHPQERYASRNLLVLIEPLLWLLAICLFVVSRTTSAKWVDWLGGSVGVALVTMNVCRIVDRRVRTRRAHDVKGGR